MLTRTITASLLTTLLLIAPQGRAEVPNLSPEQLAAHADTIVTGVVLANYQADTGSRQTSYLTQLRVLDTLKGDAAPGETVTGAWYRNQLMPWTTGTAGHRGALPEVGMVVTAHLDDRGRVLLPNGFQPGPAQHVTDQLIEQGDAEAIRAAGRAAAKAGIYAEAIRAFETLLEHPRATDRDRLDLASSLAGALRYEQALDQLRPLAFSKKPLEERAEASGMYLSIIWSMNDNEAYLEALDQFIEASSGEEKRQLKELRSSTREWFRGTAKR